MPNKNYEKGRRKEYKVREALRAEGFIAFRSAGSHSPIDVVGINVKKGCIHLIQVKSGKMSDSARQKIEEDNKDLNGTFEVKFLVV